MSLTEEILKDVELKKLIDQEKTARLENELEKNKTLCKEILTIIQKRNDFPKYLILLEYLTQRRNQSRESIIFMIKNSLNEVLPNLKHEKDSRDLLQTIIKVTEGKIFVEYEYSQAIRKMTEIYLMNNQFIRTLIVSNKVKRNHLDDEGFELLKIRFFNLMIRYYYHEKKFLEVSKCYKILFDFVKMLNEKLIDIEKKNVETKPKIIDNYIVVTKENDLKKLFENYVLFLAICPPELETKNMFNELKLQYKIQLDWDKNISYIVDKRLSDDIILIDNNLFNKFKDYEIFKKDQELIKLFRKYWIQHNLSIFEKFYSKINLKRICDMTLTPEEEVESELADMVVNNYLFAKINRIEKIVNFRQKTDYHNVLDDFNYDMNNLMKKIEETCHLINKEYLKYGIKA